MNRRKLSSTDHPITFPMYLTDGTAATGKTVTVNISKDGAAFGAASGAVTEIANGEYKIAGNATDRNTTGELRFYCTATGCDPTRFTIDIVELDPYLLPDVNVTKIGGTPQTAGDIAAAITLIDDFIDTEVAAIKAKTDNLPSDPADASDVAAAFATVNSNLATIAGYIDTEIGNLAADIAVVNGKVDTIDGVVDAILVDTAEIGAAGAGLTALATQTSVDDLPTNSELTTALSGLATTTHVQEVEDKVDAVDSVADAIKVKTDTITDIYTAQIEFAKDTTNSRDEYNVTWLKNGIPQTSGITSPTVQVVKRDATNLIASTAMTNSGSGVLIYNEATNRTTAGESYKVITVATIDAASRTFTKWIGRDV